MKLCIQCSKPFESAEWQCPHCHYTPVSNADYLVLKAYDPSQDNGFNPQLFDGLYHLEADNFWFTSRNGMIIQTMRTSFPQTASFLEIGCGTGFVLSAIQDAFPDWAIAGGEYFAEALEYTRRRVKQAPLFQLDAQQLPFEKHFDVIGMFDVLEHIDDDAAVLGQLYKACKVGGGIILTVPQHPFLWSQFDDYSFHRRRYTAQGLVERVEAAGFKVACVQSFNSVLFPIMLLSRIRKKKSSDTYDILAEFRINPTLNGFLKRAMDFERMLIRQSISFPFGGSLLMVGQRAG